MTSLRHTAFITLLVILFVCWPLRAADVVKVYVLAGQSNMEGKAKNSLFDHQAQAPETKQLFAHLRKNGVWIERDDVFIKYFNRHGKLTIGYGSPGRTGLELEFGAVVGDHHEAPVLLIKAAWGGRSLVKDFRPPSAGLPGDQQLQEELAQRVKRVTESNAKRKRQDPLPTLELIKAEYGASYREMMAEISGTLENLGTLFPELQGATPQLSGLVWFQGWNDQYNGAEQQYADNLAHFIQDVRKDLGSPELPFVIGVMGQNGSRPAEARHAGHPTSSIGNATASGVPGECRRCAHRSVG